MIRPSLAPGFVIFVVACSSGSSSGTGGSGGSPAGTGGTGVPAATALAYKPCDQAMRLGGLSVELKRNEGSTPYTAVTGAVKNAADPGAAWRELMKDGDCRLLVGAPPCSAACESGKVCNGANACVAEPLTQDTGTLTVTGLSAAVSLMWAR